MRTLVKALVSDESGAESMEYVLVAALVALASLVGATAFASSVRALFDRVATIVDSSLPVV